MYDTYSQGFIEVCCASPGSCTYDAGLQSCVTHASPTIPQHVGAQLPSDMQNLYQVYLWLRRFDSNQVFLLTVNVSPLEVALYFRLSSPFQLFQLLVEPFQYVFSWYTEPHPIWTSRNHSFSIVLQQLCSIVKAPSLMWLKLRKCLVFL